MDAESARRTVAAAAPTLASLTPGRTGNLSCRDGDRFAVTPTGVAYDEIEPRDVSLVALDGTHVAGLASSSETPMHRRLYQETDAGAVVHTHSPWATTLAVARESLPPVHYVLAHAGGRVPVADYAAYGTPALADEAARAMREAGTTATLLANHGVVAVGGDLPAAIETVRAVESTAAYYLRAQLVGTPHTLDEERVAEAAARFAEYGQPDE